MKTLRLTSPILASLVVVWLSLWQVTDKTAAKPLVADGSSLNGVSPLVADYQFSDSLNSSVGTPPALTNLGNNSFESVTLDDTSRRALKFDQNNGLSLTPTTGLLTNQSYTVVTLFSFINTNNRRRILDFKNGTSDNGLYCSIGRLLFYASGTSNINDTSVIDPNTFVQLALTRDTDGNVNGYINGVRYISFKDTSGNATIDANNTLRFFRDNNGDGEASAGYVARIRLYNVALSSTEVAALDRLPNMQTGCPSVSGISPTSGSAGTSVTISGSGLTGVTAVRFANNVAANVTVNDDTNITAIVPNGATTGIITLSKIGCDEVRTSATFTVATPSPPKLVADYQFQNTLGSSVGTPPALTNLGNNPFESVTIDSSQRTALKFDQNNGVSLFSTAEVVPNQSYTAVTLFSFINTNNRRRILDFKNGTSDNGLYCSIGRLLFYASGTSNINDTSVIDPNTFVQLALTRDTDGNVNGYINGVRYISFKDTSGNALIEGNALRFFRDNNGDGEASAGYVARIRLYNVALSSTEVAALDRLPSPASGCPTVNGLNPTTGGAGTKVTITGTNFAGATSVKFSNNVAAAFTINNDTTITATVPNGAVAGPLTISKAGCTDVQTTVFTPGANSRIVRLIDSFGSPGSTVSVPIELTAQGDENALGFSLTYDTAILSNPQVALGSDATGATLNVNASQVGQGRFGIALSLPSGQTFAGGTRQLVIVSFTIAGGTNAASAIIGVGDLPIGREVSDKNANPLAVTFTSGTILITTGYEADVAPRPNGHGNGTVTITDWVQVGRFASLLDTAAVGSEFQRADCAPRETKGNGTITVIDWVQAGRYAAGLDAVVTAGGPTGPSLTAAIESIKANAVGDRIVRAVNGSIERGQNGTVAIEFDSQGNENALGFSFTFDQTQLSFVSAAVGTGASGASLNINTNQIGRVGLMLALPAGQTLVAGTRQIVVITFTAAAAGNAVSTKINFGNQPIGLEVSDANAQALPASQTDGNISITRTATSTSAASYSRSALASESIVSAFGSALATDTGAATSLPLPTALAGTTVKVNDSVGVERLASLFYVSPTQVNYLIPLGTANGTASVVISNSDGILSTGTVQIERVAPGLFSADSSGKGLATGYVQRVKADQSQVYESIVTYDPVQQKFVPIPIDVSNPSEQVFLVIYGTGIRFNSGLSGVTIKVGGRDAQVLYAREQGFYVGLDQVNLRLPRELVGRGEVDIELIVDGKPANTVKVYIK